MLAAALISLLHGAAPTNFTAAMERLALMPTGARPPSISLDALGATIVISHAKVNAEESTLCPRSEPTGDGVRLRCTSRRLWAALSRDARGPYIDLRLLRGLPWEGDIALPVRAWPIRAYGIPDECPGRLEATKAQCALERGAFDEAEHLFKRARSGPDANFAYLRLGELAVARGEPEEAVHLFTFVPFAGPIGRLARAHLCDLTGSCLGERESTSAGEYLDLEEPLASELALLMWRREVLMNREAAAMGPFSEALQRNPDLCQGAIAMCQRMLIAGLRSESDEARSAALTGWLVQTIRRGPYELEFAREAAAAAAQLGAPGFGATVLASITPQVPADEQGEHLLRTLQLYLAARDLTRASAILEYAEGRLGAAVLGTAPWRAARRGFQEPIVRRPPSEPRAPPVSLQALEADVELARDLARATMLRGRAAREGEPHE